MDGSTDKVLIVGGGPVGATFAQLLRCRGVSFEVFDREPSMNARVGGTFVLDECLPHILGAIPDDMTDIATASANYDSGKQDTMAYIDSVRSTWVRRQGFLPRGQPGFAINARRDRYREWASQKLTIHYDKRLRNYVEDDTGVTAYFEDGTSARGTMLVGVDGASSVVRRQLLDNPSFEYSPYPAICGSVDLPRHVYKSLHNLATSLIVANSPIGHIQVAQMDLAPDGSSARYWWMVMFGSKNPRADTAWVVKQASPQALWEHALAASQHLPAMLADIVRRTGPEGMWQQQIRITDFLPPETLPHGRVTLMADAAHNAGPFGGRGVNSGLRDAVDLANILAAATATTNSSSDKSPLSTAKVAAALKEYEAIMLPRGREVVLQARAKGDCAHLLPSDPKSSPAKESMSGDDDKDTKTPPRPQLPPGFAWLSTPVSLPRASDVEEQQQSVEHSTMTLDFSSITITSPTSTPAPGSVSNDTTISSPASPASSSPASSSPASSVSLPSPSSSPSSPGTEISEPTSETKENQASMPKSSDNIFITPPSAVELHTASDQHT